MGLQAVEQPPLGTLLWLSGDPVLSGEAVRVASAVSRIADVDTIASVRDLRTRIASVRERIEHDYRGLVSLRNELVRQRDQRWQYFARRLGVEKAHDVGSLPGVLRAAGIDTYGDGGPFIDADPLPLAPPSALTALLQEANLWPFERVPS
jgi:hypothetical protein